MATAAAAHSRATSGMSDRAFLDTNIFVYDVDAGAPDLKQTIARELIDASLSSSKGVISYQVVQEFVNVALRKLKRSPEKEDFRDYVALLMFRHTVVPSSTGLVMAALDCVDRYRISWYDALIVSAAVEADCSVLYTEDLQDGMKFGRLKVVNPFRVH